jgi:ankyrin repeat protein
LHPLEKRRLFTAHAKDGNSALMRAAFKGNSAIVARLLEAGANVTVRGRKKDTPLHVACAGYAPQGKHVTVIRLLVAAGADLEARDENGQTPLHYAAVPSMPYRLAVLERLISLGADLDAKDNDGRTPLALVRQEIPLPVRTRAAQILADAIEKRDAR